MGGMDEPVLELRNIYKHFGGVTALADVCFKVMPGEVVGLIGDNGAGKSTLVKTMSGLNIPDSGEIYSRGERVRMHSVHDAAALGVQTVYQDLALCDNLNPVQNLFLGQEMRGPWYTGRRLQKAAMETRARTVLSELGVKVRNIETHVGWMSGGQRQGIAVCRSILRDPAAVILDEPTAALGVAQRAEVLE